MDVTNSKPQIAAISGATLAFPWRKRGFRKYFIVFTAILSFVAIFDSAVNFVDDANNNNTGLSTTPGGQQQ